MRGKARHPKTHCGKGHEYTKENTALDCRGHRQCKVCNADRAAQRYKDYPEKYKSAHQVRRVLHPDCTPEQRREKNLNYIGWTTKKFDSTMEEQHRLCAICKKSLTMEKKISGSRACADHEHTKPPKPRGILCTNCNLGIGNLQENVEIMEAAIAYVKKYTQEG
jgi:hypothetical protein